MANSSYMALGSTPWANSSYMALGSTPWVPPSFHHRRGLLQGEAPESALPDLFKLPVCSIYGSHNTTWLRNVPRIRLGLPSFGPIGLAEGDFHPLASSYAEPLVVLAIPGAILWAIFGITFMCFCYRRYHLGLCGEPFPTVKQYTPKQIAANRLLTAVSFTAILLMAATAIVTINLTIDNAETHFLDAIVETEGLVGTSFGTGRTLLDTVLGVLAELDGFDAQISDAVDAGEMLLNLQCMVPLLDALPAGATMLHTTDTAQAAIDGLPRMNVTDGAFALLSYPLATLPQQLPPITEALGNLRTQSALLPDLRLLATQLSLLNMSVVNATGDATAITASLVSFNGTVDALPDLPLLLDRMGRVYHSQSAEHICASIPQGWRPGDLTECDELRAQLAQTASVLEASSPATPIEQTRAYEALLADFPPLPQMVGNLTRLREVTSGVANLSRAVRRYDALNETLQAWARPTIDASLHALRASTDALVAARLPTLLPELELLRAAYVPLRCVDVLLQTLQSVNVTLLRLPALSQDLHDGADSVQAALRALPSAGQFIRSTTDFLTQLRAMPDPAEYLAAVAALDAAVLALPAGPPLTDALTAVQEALALPDNHGGLVNGTSVLHEALLGLPPTAPHTASLAAFNRSKHLLPPLIDAALATIAYYDETGDDADMTAVHAAETELRVLLANVEARPDDAALREALLALEGRVAALPATEPQQEQALRLRHALDTVPPLPPRIALMGAVEAAALAAPEVAALRASWQALNRSLLRLPDLPSARPHLVNYDAVQRALDLERALADAFALQATLGDVPRLVAAGKAGVLGTHADTGANLDLLELGLFGDDLLGYSSHVRAKRPQIDSWRTGLLGLTFLLPVVAAGLAVAACCLRKGAWSLHAGQASLALLPWVLLLGASVELPMAVMLRDGCDQMDGFIYRTLGERGETNAALARAREPLYGYMTGCVESDPMVNFFAPVDEITRVAMRNVTDSVAHLALRAAPSARVASLQAEVQRIGEALATVRTVMSCDAVHALIVEAKTALCCDLAYATTFLFISRLVTSFWMIPAAIGAIAGYKRFRSVLWGPYASVQALEVGAYL